jgi:hypothetical protein
VSLPRAAVGRLRQRLWVLWLATAALVGGGAWLAWSAWASPDRADRPDDLLTCWRFAALHNGKEPHAEGLLGPARKMSAEPVSPDEAEHIDADTFLRHGELRVVDVRPDGSAPGRHRFVLATRGGATGEPLRVRSGEKVERTQRVMTNPDVVVEVRSGKIHGVRAELGTD